MGKGLWDQLSAFSFCYDGRPSSELLGQWERREEAQRDGPVSTRRVTYRDPATGLEVTAQLRTFDDTPAQEYLLELVNTNEQEEEEDRNTPIIEDILPLDISLSLPADGRATLHHAKGSLCLPDDFLPLTDEIRPRQTLSLAPVGGRSSNGTLPFMNLQLANGGIVLGIGWSGQWAVHLERSQDTLRISAGMERTHLRLYPGERIRTPRILVIPWDGDDPIVGQNLLRWTILAHYTPRLDGEIAMPPLAHNMMYSFYRTNQVSEESELDLIPRVAELGLEAYWLDACWYGMGQGKLQWWQQVGDWRVRPDAFPHGLKPLGDAAHRLGLKFVLWFEPERVRLDTPIAREHPEFLLRCQQNPDNWLYNLGLPEARAYLADTLSRVISESGVDVYRQDFNFDPLPYWQAADAQDRVGMAEIRHVEGLYALWDELRQRHPGLTIDNCASGGRRIDLETISRSYPLWRSDFSDVGGPAHGRVLQMADQIQTAGLSRWVPLHAGPVWTFSPYDFRSAIGPGIVIYCDIRGEGFPQDKAKEAIAELESLRPYFLGDFIPLLPLTSEAHDWCAYQYHRDDLEAGFALFLRRHASPFTTMEVALRAIDVDATYEVSLADTFCAPQPSRMSGEQLLHLTICIPDRPGSMLLRYRRV